MERNPISPHIFYSTLSSRSSSQYLPFNSIPLASFTLTSSDETLFNSPYKKLVFTASLNLVTISVVTI
jgi:hypothetical protein